LTKLPPPIIIFYIWALEKDIKFVRGDGDDNSKKGGKV